MRRLLSKFALILIGICSLVATSSQVSGANQGARQGEAFLFVLAAIAVLLRSSYLAFRHRPYRRSLWLAVVLLSISGFLALIARLTPGPHYLRQCLSVSRTQEGIYAPLIDDYLAKNNGKQPLKRKFDLPRYELVGFRADSGHIKFFLPGFGHI